MNANGVSLYFVYCNTNGKRIGKNDDEVSIADLNHYIPDEVWKRMARDLEFVRFLSRLLSCQLSVCIRESSAQRLSEGAVGSVLPVYSPWGSVTAGPGHGNKRFHPKL